jgi:2-polyprenyl-6-methoxyphenol hydroxylase-like FAD-dependent oxidoreductase
MHAPSRIISSKSKNPHSAVWYVDKNGKHMDRTKKPLQIAIVGGGIGGLTTAVALQKAGLREELQQITMWMGPHRHFLIFPISCGRLMNVVAFVPPESDWRVESWTAAGDVEQLAAEFRGWDEKVARIISALDKTLRWALYDREPLDFWGVGRVTLLGDAAHAMLPHQGQGAGQSIEDAALGYGKHEEVVGQFHLELSRQEMLMVAVKI